MNNNQPYPLRKMAAYAWFLLGSVCALGPSLPLHAIDKKSAGELFWAVATRPAGIGYATGIGNSMDEARASAIRACNAAEHNSVNLPVVRECLAIGASNMAIEKCIAVVNGFIPGATFTVHTGESYQDRSPREAAMGQAFSSCRALWKSYADTACRHRNGGASNATQTTFLFCTSNAIERYAPYLPEPRVISKFHNSDGSLKKESDYVQQGPLAKAIRKIQADSNLSALEKIQRIEKARRGAR